MWETKTLSLPLLLPSGKECRNCVDRLRDSLMQVAGVRSAEVEPGGARLVLTYDPSLLTMERVERTAEEIGVDLGQRIRHETLGLSGMDCPDCAMKLEKGVQRLPGVLSAQVNFAAARMWVEFEPDKSGLPDVVARIESLGYGVESDEVEAAPPSFFTRYRNQIATGASGLCLLFGFLSSQVGLAPPVATVWFALALAAGGFPLARTAFASLRTLSLDTNFLMLLAAVGAAAIGEWSEGAMVVFLFSLGNALESLTVERTRASIRGLMETAPQTALRVDGDHDHEVPVTHLVPGDEVRVKPGSRVPVDGVVVSGVSSVEEAAITGEPLPADKAPGDEVFAGTLNGAGSLVVRATRRHEETTLSKIIHLVEEAQAQKAPVQRFTERFGRIYTPIVILFAVMTGLVWPLAFDLPFAPWFHRALTFLVVACPCALVISTPVAVAAAIGRAARGGVLTKGGAAMETLAGIRCVAFDKTGTLTAGKARVTDVIAAEGVAPEEVVAAAAAVELHSEHPIARAILHYAKERNILATPAEDFLSRPGRGATGTVGKETVLVGNRHHLQAHQVALDVLQTPVKGWQSQGKTPVWVARGGRLIGALAVEDTVRDTSRAALDTLRANGIRVVMLTGDDEPAARAIAQQLGIDEFRANLLPEGKVDAVNDLLKWYGRVAMVGDGVNDAPALAASSVGIAMGAAGSDVALETADVALMGDDLNGVAFAVGLSRKMAAVIRQNLAFAVVVVLALIGSIFFGKIGLAAGVLGHEGSALLVILNGMRLLKERVAA